MKVGGAYYFCGVQLVQKEIRNRVGYVILNRPEKRNALSTELVQALSETIEHYLKREEVKVIVLRSADKPFCAGADLAYLAEIRNNSLEENVSDSQRLRRLFDLLHKGDKIFISQVEGPALAGGCGLATVCDFCFATPEATFGYTESRIGFVPALVAVYLQGRVKGADMRDMLLTGRVFTAEEAHRLGLVNRVIPDTEITPFVDAFADELCRTVSGGSVSFIKELLREMPGKTMDQALDFAAELNARARSSSDCIRGIDSFLNKEKISW